MGEIMDHVRGPSKLEGLACGPVSATVRHERGADPMLRALCMPAFSRIDGGVHGYSRLVPGYVRMDQTLTCLGIFERV